MKELKKMAPFLNVTVGNSADGREQKEEEYSEST